MIKKIMFTSALSVALSSVAYKPALNPDEMDLSVRHQGYTMARPALSTALLSLAQKHHALNLEGQTAVDDSFLKNHVMNTINSAGLNRINLNGTRVTEVGIRMLLESQNTGVLRHMIGQSARFGGPSIALDISIDSNDVRAATFKSRGNVTAYTPNPYSRTGYDAYDNVSKVVNFG